jgi:Tfp pilus assembly protein PilP
MRAFGTILLFVFLSPSAAPAGQGQAAQTPTPAAPAPAQAAAAQTPASEPAPGGMYAYQSDGRRDPFVSLLGIGADSRGAQKRAEGAAGLAVAELSVRGVMQSRGALVAMVQGPDNRTYIVHQGDKLLDGTIKSITPQGLVIVQEVNDPLSLAKQREVRKLLRSIEDVKE